MRENIIGGVSPLKRRRGKTAGKGKFGIGDTRYTRDKWQKPPSGGTFYTPTPAPRKPYTKTPKGEVITNQPNVTNITNNAGDVNTINQTMGNDLVWVDPVYGEREKEIKIGSWDYSKGNPTYKQAWESNLENIQNIYGSFDDYVKDLEDQKSGKKERPKDYKKPEYIEGGTTKTTKEKYLIKEGYWKNVNAGGNQTANITTNKMLGSPGKYKLGGYRTMKKQKKKN